MLLVVLVASTARAAPPSVPTLCDAGTTAFTCETTRGKVASICASADLTRETGWIRYRFGRPGAIELAVPAAHDPEDPGWEQFVLATLLDDDDLHQEAALRFQNAGVGYAVYESWPQADYDTGKVGDRAGIWVLTGGKLIAEIPCARWQGSFFGLKLDWVIDDHPKNPPK